MTPRPTPADEAAAREFCNRYSMGEIAPQLANFAASVRADEREACAKVLVAEQDRLSADHESDFSVGFKRALSQALAAITGRTNVR